MAANLDPVEIVHAGTPHPAIVEGKSEGLDKIDRHAQAGGQPKNGAGILGNVGLVESKTHERMEPAGRDGKTALNGSPPTVPDAASGRGRER
jgi:hypothetical protein